MLLVHGIMHQTGSFGPIVYMKLVASMLLKGCYCAKFHLRVRHGRNGLINGSRGEGMARVATHLIPSSTFL